MSASSKKVMTQQFFWEKKAKKNKSRFNLLLLDYGEYFLEDLSVYFFPVPTNDLSKAFEVQESLKVHGRLKLASRSLVFEPSDIKLPIVKFPYKSITTPLQIFNMKQSELAQMSIEVVGFFTFLCANYYEMKANDKVGPYKCVEYQQVPQQSDSLKGHRIVFALVHSDLQNFLVKVEQFRHIFSVAEKKGSGMGFQLLKPFLDSALITTFDTTSLIDFHEKLLLKSPVSVKKVKPLIVNPGILMITETRIYFQPSSLNNIGDPVQNFEFRKILKIFNRRHLLRQTGLEIIMQDGTSVFFSFESRVARDEIYDLIMQQPTVYRNQQTSTLSVLSAMQKWQRREMSNFDYLMFLNSEADRSFNDLTQYPVRWQQRYSVVVPIPHLLLS
jgi:factor associated with neutral sphingomyelinase activation